MEQVKVELGPASYTIHVGPGSLARLGELNCFKNMSSKALIITDETVGALYGGQVAEALQKVGFCTEIKAIVPGEESKSFAVAEELYTKAITMGLDRLSPIVALGGGVVGDLAGFVAATYMRGVPFIQIPTSLLAQVDSSVGGKVAINHPLGKNLIGAFYQPKTVLIDPVTLDSLPDRELSTGLAELIKHGLIADSQLFVDLQKNSTAIWQKDTALFTRLISRSCRIKADVVQQDERETGLRMILNFGHTIGHAVEKATNFGYSHGEAVAIGMHGAALISRDVGLCSQQTVDKVCDMLAKYCLPLKAQGCTAHELASYLMRDKKTIGGKVNWVLLADIGTTVIRNDIPEAVVLQALRQITIDSW
jgi:3-dehydroquinate synthase